MANVSSNDWWARERQRLLKRVLVCCVLVLALIGYFRYINMAGRTGIINGVNFPTKNYIAFVRREDDGSSAIYAVRADGSDLRRLTTGNDAANKEHPCWTPDGKTLVFSSNLKDLRTSQLYVLGDGSPVQLTYGTGNKFLPTVSPNGKLVAFVTQGVVKTVSITGTDVTQVLPLPRAGNENGGDTGESETESAPYLSAAFGSDGTTLCGIQDVSNITIPAGPSQSDHPGAKRVPFASLPIDQQVVVLPGYKNEAYPPNAWGHEVSISWEPNGTRLACSYTELPMLGTDDRPVDILGKPLPKGANPLPISGIQIWTYPQSKEEEATKKPSFEPFYGCLGYSAEPRNIEWSPATVSSDTRTSHIACEIWLLKSEGVRELAGIRVLDLVEPLTKETEPRQTRIMTMPADVGNIQYIVKSTPEGRPQNPHWSPDGSRLVYEVVRSNGKRDIWTINSDGTNPINLTKGAGDNADPAWSPSQ